MHEVSLCNLKDDCPSLKQEKPKLHKYSVMRKLGRGTSTTNLLCFLNKSKIISAIISGYFKGYRVPRRVFTIGPPHTYTHKILPSLVEDNIESCDRTYSAIGSHKTISQCTIPTPNTTKTKASRTEDCFFASLHLNGQIHFSLNPQTSLPPFIPLPF